MPSPPEKPSTVRRRQRPRSFRLFTLGRWACIPFSLSGGYVCYRWARQWFGDAAGLMALALGASRPTSSPADT